MIRGAFATSLRNCDDLSEPAFHEVADATLEALQDALDDLEDQVDDAGHGDDFDVTCSQGVLTASFGAAGTWVINKQTPNRQIWWSSPVSGPKRFEFEPLAGGSAAVGRGRWTATRGDEAELGQLLAVELGAELGLSLGFDGVHRADDLGLGSTPV
eukprot:g1710.t1